MRFNQAPNGLFVPEKRIPYLTQRRRKGPELKMHAGLKGKFSFKHERDGKLINEGEFNNLLTDYAIDRTAYYAWSYSNSSLEWPATRSYGYLSESSVEPAVSDATMDSLVMTVAGDRPRSKSGASMAVVGDYVEVTHRIAFVFEIDGSYNVTKFGTGFGDTGTSLISSALIEDELGDPATITVIANDRLTVYHDMVFILHYSNTGEPYTITIDEYDRGGSLLASVDYPGTGSWYGADPTGIMKMFGPAGPYTGGTVTRAFHGHTYTTLSTSYRSSTVGGYIIDSTIDGYVSGSNERFRTIACTADQLNGVMNGFGLRATYRETGGYMFVFDSGTFEKLNTHTFEIGLRHSWGRAA